MKKRILLCCAFIATLILGIGMLVFADDSVNGFYSDYNSSLKAPFYQTESVELNLPLTYEATVYFPKYNSIVDNYNRGGVIFGNYTDGSIPCVNFEIHNWGNPRLYIVDGNGIKHNFIFTNVNVYTGEPVHLAITLDPSTNTCSCYVNGEFKQSISITNSLSSFTLPSSSYVLGGDFRKNNTEYFKGKIQGLAMYYDTRTATEVQADYQANEIDTDNLLAYYDFSDVEHWGQLAAYSPVAGMNLPFANTNDNPDYWLSEGTSPSEYDYSFAVVGDTQSLTKYYPDKLDNLYDWIIANKNSKKIEYVVGLGDLVDTYKTIDYDEWDRVKAQFNKMDEVNLPYSIVRGNHDDLTTFNQYFTVSEFQNTFTGNYGDTMTNTYHKFTVNGLNYMILCLDTIEEKDENLIKWANDLIADNPDYNVIVTTHIYLLSNGKYCGNDYGGYTGQELWDKLVSKHKNIVLMLCGHVQTDDIIVQHAVGRNGNVVPQILIDPQDTDKMLGGLGLVSMFYFSDGGSKLTIDYYATARSAYFKKENQMELSLNVVQPDGTIKGYVTKQYSSADEIVKDENEVPYYDDNYLFAGWYSDADCADEDSLPAFKDGCYAKFVDREVLTVALQLQAGTTSATTKSAVKFLTSVDSTNYQKVGFTVDIKQNGVSVFDGDGKDVATTDVYKTVKGYTDGEGKQFTPSETFAKASTYFAGYELTEIANLGNDYSDYNQFAWTFVITPYWITRDGAKVSGLTKTFEINDLIDYEAEIDKLTSEGGTKHVWYPTLEEALDEAQTNNAASSVTILKDVEINGTLEVTQPLTLQSREGVDLTITRGAKAGTADDYTYNMLQNKTINPDNVVSIQAGIDAYGHGSLTFDSRPIKDGDPIKTELLCNVIRNDIDNDVNTDINKDLGTLTIGKQVRIQNHVGHGSTKEDGVNSAIYNTGKAILYCDLLDNDSSALGSPIVNAKKAELTIAGGNYIGNIGHLETKAGVLYNLGGTVQITGGNFYINQGGYAGVVYNASGSKLTISGGQFAGNVANPNTSADTYNGAGVVRNQKAELTITGGTFNYNYGSYSGVVHNYTNDTTKTTVTITGGTFTNNYAQNKEGTGVIRNENANSSITIDEGTFIGNVGGSNQSGVLYNYGGIAKITGGTFSANQGGYAGVVHNYTKSDDTTKATMTITGGTFTNNYAQKDDGTGVIRNQNANSSITIDGGTFIGNVGGSNKSGVLYNLAGTAEITGGKFDSNHSGRGGVIYNGSAATLTITGGEFMNNYATANGGGVIENNASSLTIAGTYGSRVIMKNNYWKPTIPITDQMGGGAILYSHSAPTLIIGGCVIEDNNGLDIDGATEVADITVASAACGDVTFTDGTFKGIFQANGGGWTSDVVFEDGSSRLGVANRNITKATYLYLNWNSKTLSTEAPKEIEYGPIIK